MRAWPLIAAGAGALVVLVTSAARLPWWAAVPAGYAAMLAVAWLADRHRKADR
jgi:hypothetical protein